MFFSIFFQKGFINFLKENDNILFWFIMTLYLGELLQGFCHNSISSFDFLMFYRDNDSLIPNPLINESQNYITTIMNYSMNDHDLRDILIDLLHLY